MILQFGKTYCKSDKRPMVVGNPLQNNWPWDGSFVGQQPPESSQHTSFKCFCHSANNAWKCWLLGISMTSLLASWRIWHDQPIFCYIRTQEFQNWMLVELCCQKIARSQLHLLGVKGLQPEPHLFGIDCYQHLVKFQKNTVACWQDKTIRHGHGALSRVRSCEAQNHSSCHPYVAHVVHVGHAMENQGCHKRSNLPSYNQHVWQFGRSSQCLIQFGMVKFTKEQQPPKAEFPMQCGPLSLEWSSLLKSCNPKTTSP